MRGGESRPGVSRETRHPTVRRRGPRVSR